MTAFFTDFFQTYLAANPTVMNLANVRIVLFRSAPSLNFGVAKYTGVQTVSDLETFPGWRETVASGYPFTPISVAVYATGSISYALFADFPFDSLSFPVEVEAFGFVLVGTFSGVVNPLIFVTNSPTGLHTTVYASDSLAAAPDPDLPTAAPWWFFSWNVDFGLGEGPLAFAKGAPTFDVSNSQHVWMFPQRANMIANPSFERAGTGYWSSNNTLTREPDPAFGGGFFSGKVAGVSPCILESNVFPTLLGESSAENWTIQLKVKGIGILKVGLVFWDRDFRSTGTDWGTEEWVLSTDEWIHIRIYRRANDAYQAMLRLEVTGTVLHFDQVLAERGFLQEWPYFDGDERFGARDDFSWYGGASRAGASYSFWYNNRRAIVGRLFARVIDPGAPGVTDAEIEQQGLVYSWVPAGISVVPHMDVLHTGDLQGELPAQTPGVLPYFDAVTEPDGVLNPWV